MLKLYRLLSGRPMRYPFFHSTAFLPPPPILFPLSKFTFPVKPQNMIQQQQRQHPRCCCERTINTDTKTTRRKEARRRRQELNLSIAAELEQLRKTEDLVTIKLSIPYRARINCRLSHQLKRTRVFIPKASLNDFYQFKTNIYNYLIRLFPELNSTNNLCLLPNVDSFHIETSEGHKVSCLNDLSHITDNNVDVERVSNITFVIMPEYIPGGIPSVPEKLMEIERNVGKAQMLEMVSFYRFFDIKHPELFAKHLKRIWLIFGITGRVYIASEGVNAQLAVPGSVWKEFKDLMNGKLRVDVDYYDLPKELIGVFLNVDRPVSKDEVPFRDLRILPRNQVLADGWNQPLELNRMNGKEILPNEWHEKMKNGIMKNNNVILLDCRNEYESRVGQFEHAIPLNTKTFRDTWNCLEKRLANEDRNKQVMTYCTGGIRCVKVNAYLEQKMGFKNTGRLAGGIVSYARMLRETNRLDESSFKGVNHVFDARIGEQITEDVLSRCTNCGAPATTQTDCSNPKCRRPFESRLFIQCPDCATLLAGACSETCREAVLTDPDNKLSDFASFVVGPKREAAVIKGEKSERLYDEAYAIAFSEEEPALLREVRRFTEKEYPKRARMLSGPLLGSLLKLLVASTSAKRVLEIGTFTGYSAVYMASGLPEDGKLITCEIDEKAADVAQSFFACDPVLASRIDLRVGAGLTTLGELKEEKDKPVDTVAGLSEASTFDFAFIDADKKSYRAYYEMLVGEGLLRVGGLMVLDNVLFRGRVAGTWMNSDVVSEISESDDDDEKETLVSNKHGRQMTTGHVMYSSVDQRRRLKSLENAKKIAQSLHEFNEFVKSDPRTEHVVLPVRDGATILRRLS